MYYHPRLKLGFMHMPKTGGTFMRRWLLKAFAPHELRLLGRSKRESRPVVAKVAPSGNDGGLSPHATYTWYLENFPQYKLATARVYTMIREPFAHALSFFRQLAKHGDYDLSFEEHYRTNPIGWAKRLTDHDGNCPAKKLLVYQTETVDALMKSIWAAAGHGAEPPPKLRPQHVSPEIPAVLTVAAYDDIVRDYDQWFDYGNYDRRVIPASFTAGPGLEEHIARLKEEDHANRTLA